MDPPHGQRETHFSSREPAEPADQVSSTAAGNIPTTRAMVRMASGKQTPTMNEEFEFEVADKNKISTRSLASQFTKMNKSRADFIAGVAGYLGKNTYKNKDLGYVRLKSFNENSDKQFIKKVKNYEKQKNLIGYIIDLRNNPGGLLNQAISITDFFLEKGEIVSTKGRRISETRKFFARAGDGIKGKPVIVLINNGSASASEIFAGALKDHKRAIILGENSYGKGSVQSIIPLRNGGGIRLTISKYYLPSGKSISEVGVSPDITVEEQNQFELETDKDNQLKYAINLFQS